MFTKRWRVHVIKWITMLSVILFFSCGKSADHPGSTENPNPPDNSDTTDNTNTQEPKPNFIIIIAESHRAEAMEGSGNPFVKTPNLKELASEGAKFTNFFVTTAICTVSRSSILSGQTEHTIGNDVFSDGFTEAAFSKTYPMQLKQAGYYIGWIGLFGPPDPPKDDFNYYKHEPWKKNGVHNTDLIVNDVNTFLSDYKNDAPFCMCINFNAAHEIDPTASTPAHYVVQSRFANLYSNISIPEPATADPDFWADSMPTFFKNPENIARKRWKGFFSTTELFEENAKDYYRLITGLDDAVGRIRAQLKKEALEKNTIIIYTSDHGVSLGEHGIMGKWYPYDVSMHVPFILYDPRNTALSGTVNHDFALNIDIAPTILNLAGLQPPDVMEGRNLLDFINGKATPRDYFFYEFGIYGAPRLFKTKAVISKQYRYIRYTENGYEQLFNIVDDPDESVNLADDPDYAGTLQDMRDLLQSQP